VPGAAVKPSRNIALVSCLRIAAPFATRLYSKPDTKGRE
jgi:hypothetical protein